MKVKMHLLAVTSILFIACVASSQVTRKSTQPPQMTVSGTRADTLKGAPATLLSTSGNIYGSGSGRKVSTSPYQDVILRHPTFRAQYNQIMLDLLNGPLTVANVQAFLNQAEATISSALAADPFPTTDGSPADEFNRLRAWVAARAMLMFAVN